MCFWQDYKRQTRLTSERIKELTAINELSTTEYTVAKVVKAEDAPAWFRGEFGDRKILYSCRIYLKAGINMDKYDSSKTVINAAEKSISLSLPHATLISFNMPPEEQRQEYKKVGLLRKSFKAGELNDLLIQGEESVREEIEQMGILEDAERNARDIFKAALTQLGYQYVNIKFE